jgi:ketosteroid isomerase-like protein
MEGLRMTPQDVLTHLHRAMNDHDIEAFLSLIAEDYRSQQPAHPDRAFGGRAQVRENWSGLFLDVPDFRAELVSAAVEDTTIWAEWEWSGTRADGSPLLMRGVTLFGLDGGLIVWGRLYLELLEEDGADIREFVRQMRQGGEARG